MPSFAQTLEYPDLVSVMVAEAGAVDVVDSSNNGHRVQVNMALAALNGAFSWERTPDSAAPVGSFTTSGTFTSALSEALDTGFTDNDPQTGVLSFDSNGNSGLDTTSDPRLRDGAAISANDLVLAYVLYKVYGNSGIDTTDLIINMSAAYGMLSTVVMMDAIDVSFTAASAATPNTINTMFQDLLASDSGRFIDPTTGATPTGMFGPGSLTNIGVGDWGLVVGDIIEVKMEFEFANNVTLRSAGTNSEAISITAGDKFKLRLQITATA